MNLFKCEASDPKLNAQRNLMGRTHYVDDDTLRFHKSRVISARHTDQGLLFAIVTSDSLDYQNTRRGFRFVVFDIFGTVISRTDVESAFRRSEQATKAMWDFVNGFDAVSHTRQATEKAINRYLSDMGELKVKVDKIADEIGHARPVTPSGSVECPHCHWGFQPALIEQHIREKH